MTRAARDLVDLLDALEQALATIRRHGPGILDRASIPAGRDGYPARASGAQATSARVVRHECALRQGDPGLVRAECSGCDYTSPWWPQWASAMESATQHEDEHGSPTYSDPTGGAATTHSEPDPVRALGRRTIRDLARTANTLTALANALTTETGKGATLNDPTDWCAHHLRFGIHETRRPPINGRPAGDLCRWCADFSREQGQMPPKALVEKRARGERITAVDVDRALARKAG